MLGKKSSLGHLKEYLSIDKKINNVSDTQFCQGHTMRWGLAWSFNQTQLNQFNYFKVIQFSVEIFVYLFFTMIYFRKIIKISPLFLKLIKTQLKINQLNLIFRFTMTITRIYF